jgi:hypothetical protein
MLRVKPWLGGVGHPTRERGPGPAVGWAHGTRRVERIAMNTAGLVLSMAASMVPAEATAQ